MANRTCPCKRLPLALSSFTAAAYGDIGSLEKRLIDGKIDRTDVGGYTLLHLAAQHGHIPSALFLLERGIRVDAGPNGATPLHRASFSGAVGTMAILLDHGASLSSQDTSFGDLMTPLHKAVAGGRPLAVKLILHYASSTQKENMNSGDAISDILNAKDSMNRTPLEVAHFFVSKQEEERLSVRRWDDVAGGTADWETCVALLEDANSSCHSSQELTKSVEALSVMSCMVCSDGTSCPLASWESVFRSKIQGLTRQVLVNNKGGVPSCIIANESSRMPRVNDVSCIIIVNESSPMVKENDFRKTTEKHEPLPSHQNGSLSDSQQMGQPCGICGKPSIALYPKHGKLICRTCKRTNTRKIK
mmetsp:Transcript_30921/g.47405  ORF Transcript_30921/g.47405 Transcript_30921/m.47405 type:complete len:360 (+) Transcript_30921:46-1125(+)